MVLPASDERVPRHTEEHINQRIEDEMHYRLCHYAHHTDEIDQRLRELDREWDIERALEANASALALTGLCMGTTIAKKWYLLSAGVMGFLLQHAVQGWCPPVGLFRRIGFRTASEIEQERSALKALRGDFADVEPQREDNVNQRVEQAYEAVQRHRRQHHAGHEAMATPPSSSPGPGPGPAPAETFRP